jgi:hypothetical protein
MILAQVAEAADVAVKTLEGRSESLIVVIVGIVLVGFVLWRDTKKQEKEDERQDRRETAQIEKDKKDSESLKVISDSTKRAAEAVTLIAKEMALQNVQQERDRRAIFAVIESVDARAEGNEARAKESLQNAKRILIEE